MDRKTLEYLEKRAQKGREIVSKIEKLQKLISKATSESFKCIRLALDSNSIDVTRWGESQVSNNYESEAEAHMLNAFIDVTRAEIKRLEQELAEL